MPSIIDADTHVDESEATWASLEGSKHVPVTVSPSGEALDLSGRSKLRNRWWLVEGRLQTRQIRDDAHHPTRERRELADIEGRLEDMDRLGVATQVVFPTFFIRYGASDTETEAALAGAYNRWIAERCALSNGRLQWAVVLPLRDPDRAVAELQWAKANGACAIYRRGFDLDKPADDPHFFPVYEAANDLDLPLCFHTGHPLPGREWDRGYPVMSAFTAVVGSELPSKFPKLRFGFVEAGASWIPYALSQLAMLQRQQQLHERPSNFELAQDLFRTDRLYVTIDPVDYVEHLLDFGTEDNLMVGTDYCHSDQSANLAALDEVQRWADEGRISEAVARKILETNARNFYGLAS
jgi:predicted TIM-barrel fold metal-dependent hydrolase